MSQEQILAQIAREMQLRLPQVQSCVTMLDEGNTVPFIARYRKEATGEMDENQIRDLSERLTYLRNLEAEKEKVLRVIGEQGKLEKAAEVRIETSSPALTTSSAT